jgi:hypothetical protein
MTLWHMRIACWIRKATHTHFMQCFCFPTATIVARTRRNVTAVRTLLVVLGH